MPFKSISRHQPSQQEPKLSWPSLTGKYLKVCRYHQNKTPQRSLLPKQQQSSNPRQQKAPKPLDVAGNGSYFRPLAEVIHFSTNRSHHPKHASPTVLRHFMVLQALRKAVRHRKEMSHQCFAAWAAQIVNASLLDVDLAGSSLCTRKELLNQPEASSAETEAKIKSCYRTNPKNLQKR